MGFSSTKTYGHNFGMSACFRQWRATHSHCSFLHGYALAISYEFEATELDIRNWVVDFGGLDILKDKLKAYFDHKTVVASDDPELDYFYEMHRKNMIDLVVVDAVGCEAFAKMAYEFACEVVEDGRVTVTKCEVSEHGANSAIYRP